MTLAGAAATVPGVSTAPRPTALGSVVTLAWLLGAMALYGVMGAEVFYKTDGPDLLRLLQTGERHPWHVGYLPALSMFAGAAEWLGLQWTPIALGNAFSAVGMAVWCARIIVDATT